MAILRLDHKKFADFVLAQIRAMIFLNVADIGEITKNLLDGMIKTLNMSETQRNAFIEYIKLNTWKVYHEK
jgi:hypothetical protein